MKKLLSIFLLCWPALASFSLTQFAHTTGSGTGGSGSCNSSSCTVNVTSTGSGHLLVIVFYIDNDGVHTGLPISVSGGGTWVEGTPAIDYADTITLDCWYILSSNAGATSVSTTFTNSAIGKAAFFWEIPYTGSSAAKDYTNSLLTSSNTSPFPGVALTITGTNDVLIQAAFPANYGITAISSGYTRNATAASEAGAYSLNSTNGTAPTWTVSTADTGLSVGLAFKEITSASKVCTLSLLGAGPC